jgi:hypothetical protein
MISCTKCGKVETIVKSGFVRGKQRLYCKDCELYFSINPPNFNAGKKHHQTTIVDIAKILGILAVYWLKIRDRDILKKQ